MFALFCYMRFELQVKYGHNAFIEFVTSSFHCCQSDDRGSIRQIQIDYLFSEGIKSYWLLLYGTEVFPRKETNREPWHRLAVEKTCTGCGDEHGFSSRSLTSLWFYSGMTEV